MLSPKEIQKLRTMVSVDEARLPELFGALGDPRRCNIFRSFLKKEKLCVSDVARTFSISMSLASQHLKILEAKGLVAREKEGRIVYFKPNTADSLVASIIKAVQ